MMGVLLSQEMKGKGICVSMLHPGFNKTDMTKKYEAIWEIEGNNSTRDVTLIKYILISIIKDMIY